MYRAIPEKTKRTIRELVKQGMSYRDICSSLRVSMGSVYNAVHEEKYRPDEDIQKVAAAIKHEMAAKYLLLADAMLESVSEREVGNASLKDLALAAAILTDKAAMLDPSLVNKPEEPKPAEKKEETAPAPART